MGFRINTTKLVDTVATQAVFKPFNWNLTGHVAKELQNGGQQCEQNRSIVDQ